MQGHKKKGSLAFLVITILLLFCAAGVAFAEEDAVQSLPMQVPAIFYGVVNDATGQPVVDGIVRAYVGGELCGSLSLKDGAYGMPEDDPSVKRLLVFSSTRDLTGDKIVFKVFTGGKEYSATTVPAQLLWESGQRERVDLSMSLDPDPFLDMHGHWAAETVQQFVYKGLIYGYEDYTFRPENSISRAECAVILARALSLSDGNQTELAGFKDSTNIPAWAAGPVSAVLEAGLIKGYPEEDGTKTYRPDLPVTRVELAVILGRVAAGKLGGQQPEVPAFTDWDQVSDWAREDVSIATNLGLLKGYPEGDFRPANVVTRAEAVTMISRLLETI